MNGSMTWDEKTQIANLTFDKAIKNWQDLVINETVLTLDITGLATDEYHIDWEVKEKYETGFAFYVEFEDPSEIGLFEEPD